MGQATRGDSEYKVEIFFMAQEIFWVKDLFHYVCPNLPLLTVRTQSYLITLKDEQGRTRKHDSISHVRVGRGSNAS